MTEEQQGGPPPWIDPTMQQQITWRDRDIVVSVPIKSGTTWMMNIVHQVLTGGDPDFEDIYAEVPWIEFVTRPGMPVTELLGRLEKMSPDQPRAFKTHSAPPVLPHVEPTGDRDVRYIVVCRNPEEALVSAKPFLEKHTDEFYALWDVPSGALARPDFPTFYREVVDARGINTALFEFLHAWWPLRHRANVLLLHFADLKHDHDGSIRRVASFLGADPSDDQWDAITRYTSFAWMKEHGTKFDGTTIAAVPVLAPGAMVRRGVAGAAVDDGMTPEISDHLRGVGRRVVSDEQALRWCYEGGPHEVGTT